MPTSTWQTYNFYDADGDGWGDTWYARWKTLNVDPTRPHANRGVPYRFRSYDLQFLRWLASTGREVDFYADEDVERFPSAAALRAAYDLVVFPGHTEYVTTRLYDLISGSSTSGARSGARRLPCAELSTWPATGASGTPRSSSTASMLRRGPSRARA